MWVCWTEDAPEEWEQFWVEPLNGSRKEDKLIKRKKRKKDDFEAEQSTEKMKMWKRLRKLDGKKIHARSLAHENFSSSYLHDRSSFPSKMEKETQGVRVFSSTKFFFTFLFFSAALVLCVLRLWLWWCEDGCTRVEVMRVTMARSERALKFLNFISSPPSAHERYVDVLLFVECEEKKCDVIGEEL